MDGDRVTWVRLFRFLCHFWNDEFLKFISTPFGALIRTYDITACQTKMDVARFLIRITCFSLIDEKLMVYVGDLVMKLKVLEDTQGPLRICVSKRSNSEVGSLVSMKKMDDASDGLDSDS